MGCVNSQETAQPGQRSLSQNNTYKLTYFDAAGTAEPTRLAFSIGKIEFEDNRLSFPEWGKMKMEGGAKFGGLPLLEINGKQFAQSRAILRHVGILSGLYPQDDVDCMVVDEGIDLSADILQKTGPPMFATQDPEQKKKELEELSNKILPQFFGYIEKQVNQSSDGYYGKSLSVADLFIFSLFNMIVDYQHEHFTFNFNQYKGIKNLVSKVSSIPEVKQFYSQKQNEKQIQQQS